MTVMLSPQLYVCPLSFIHFLLEWEVGVSVFDFLLCLSALLGFVFTRMVVCFYCYSVCPSGPGR